MTTAPQNAPTRLATPAALAAAALAVVVSLSSLKNGFAFDDVTLVERNPVIRSLANLPRIFTEPYWGEGNRNGLFRPLAVASYALNHAIHGTAPFGYHLANVLLAGLAAFLAAALARRLSGREDVALVAGLLFAAHPVHTEAIAGVIGRAELLSGAAVFGALLLEVGERRGRGTAVASSALLLAGLLSKESAIVFFAGLFLMIWRGSEPLLRSLAAAARRSAPYLPAVAIWLVLRSVALEGAALPVSEKDNPIAFAAFPAATMTALKALGLYVALTVLPVRLSPDYSFDAIPLAASPLDPGFLAGLAAAALLVFAGVRLRKPRPAAAIGIFFYLAALLPVSNLLFPIGTIFGERLLFLPSFGACLAAGALLATAPRPAVAAIVVLLSARSAIRNPDWRDNRTLFESAAIARPSSAKANAQLGFAAQAAGETALAESAFARALAIDPDYADVWSNVGAIRHARGEKEGARAAWEKAIASDPSHGPALANLATLEREAGDLEAAERLERRAAESRPRDALYRLKLAATLLDRGRPREAAETFRAALAIDDSIPDAWSALANALLLDGDARGALDAAERAAALAPGDARMAGTLGLALFEFGDEARAERELRRALAMGPGLDVAAFHLARLLGTALDPSLRKPAEARRLLERLLERDPGNAAYLDLEKRLASD